MTEVAVVLADTCRWGHPRTEENTLPRSDGRKDCRVCSKLRGRKRHGEAASWKDRLAHEAEVRGAPVINDPSVRAMLAPMRGSRVRLGAKYARLPESHGRLRAAQDALAEGHDEFAKAQIGEALLALRAMLDSK